MREGETARMAKNLTGNLYGHTWKHDLVGSIGWKGTDMLIVILGFSKYTLLFDNKK